MATTAARRRPPQSPTPDGSGRPERHGDQGPERREQGAHQNLALLQGPAGRAAPGPVAGLGGGLNEFRKRSPRGPLKPPTSPERPARVVPRNTGNATPNQTSRHQRERNGPSDNLIDSRRSWRRGSRRPLLLHGRLGGQHQVPKQGEQQAASMAAPRRRSHAVSTGPPRKKTDALEGHFLEPGEIATQAETLLLPRVSRDSSGFPHHRLMCRSWRSSVEILHCRWNAWAPFTNQRKQTGPAGWTHGTASPAHDLAAPARPEGESQAEAGPEAAASEVVDDAEGNS